MKTQTIQGRIAARNAIAAFAMTLTLVSPASVEPAHARHCNDAAPSYTSIKRPDALRVLGLDRDALVAEAHAWALHWAAKRAETLARAAQADIAQHDKRAAERFYARETGMPADPSSEQRACETDIEREMPVPVLAYAGAGDGRSARRANAEATGIEAASDNELILALHDAFAHRGRRAGLGIADKAAFDELAARCAGRREIGRRVGFFGHKLLFEALLGDRTVPASEQAILGCIGAARDLGHLGLSMSGEDLAVALGLDVSTVWRALGRLEAQGAIVVVPRRRNATPSELARNRAPTRKATNAYLPSPRFLELMPLLDPEHPQNDVLYAAATQRRRAMRSIRRAKINARRRAKRARQAGKPAPEPVAPLEPNRLVDVLADSAEAKLRLAAALDDSEATVGASAALQAARVARGEQLDLDAVEQARELAAARMASHWACVDPSCSEPSEAELAALEIRESGVDFTEYELGRGILACLRRIVPEVPVDPYEAMLERDRNEMRAAAQALAAKHDGPICEDDWACPWSPTPVAWRPDYELNALASREAIPCSKGIKHKDKVEDFTLDKPRSTGDPPSSTGPSLDRSTKSKLPKRPSSTRALGTREPSTRTCDPPKVRISTKQSLNSQGLERGQNDAQVDPRTPGCDPESAIFVAAMRQSDATGMSPFLADLLTRYAPTVDEPGES